MSTAKIGVLVGSTRQGSYSQALARAALRVAPESLDWQMLKIDDLPFYNQDLEASEQSPQSWADFRAALSGCDGFLFVTPEYNRSIPALLKNAIDIGSRPSSEPTWAGKPGLVISQSPGQTGGFGANQALRAALMYPNVILMNQPEGYFGNITTLINPESGEIEDERTLKFLGKIMTAFAAWVERINCSR